MQRIIPALTILKEANLDTTEYCELITNHYSPTEAAQSIIKLNNLGLLTTDNLSLIKFTKTPNTIIEITIILSKLGIIDDQSRKILTIDRISEDCIGVIRGLSYIRLLNNQNLSRVIQCQGLWQRIANYIYRIPTHLFTSDLLRLITDTYNRFDHDLDATANALIPIINEIINQPTTTPTQIKTINPAQSTHTSSIHHSVSCSLLKLAKRYSDIDVDNLINQLNEFKSDIKSNFCDIDINMRDAACEFIESMENIFESTEATSKFTVKYIIALVWYALNSNDLSSVNDAVNNLIAMSKLDQFKLTDELINKVKNSAQRDIKIKFIKHLYEIRREYNLDTAGEIANNLERAEACIGGTINKLVATLDRAHPDVQLVYVTRNTASVKFQSLVRCKIWNMIASQPHLEALSIIDHIFTQQNSMNTHDDGINWLIPDDIKIKINGKEISLYQSVSEMIKTEFTQEFMPFEIQGLLQPGTVNGILQTGEYVSFNQTYKSLAEKFRCEHNQAVSSMSLFSLNISNINPDNESHPSMNNINKGY